MKCFVIGKIFLTIFLFNFVFSATSSSTSAPKPNSTSEAPCATFTGEIGPDGKLKTDCNQSVQDIYNKSSAADKGEMQNQSLLSDMFGANIMDTVNSGNIEKMFDKEVQNNAKFYGPAAEAWNKANTENSVVNTANGTASTNAVQLAISKATGAVGNSAISSGKISCYLSRGQQFYSFQCSLNGMKFESPDKSQSPAKAKENCLNNCYQSAGSCLAVDADSTNTNALTQDLNEVLSQSPIKFDVATAQGDPNKNPAIKAKTITKTIQKTFNYEEKAKKLSFTYNSEYTLELSVSYKDETGYQRVAANKLILSPTKGQDVVKSFNLSQTIKELTIKFEITDQELTDKYGTTNTKNQPVVKDLTLFIPKTTRYVCPGDDISFDEKKRSACSPSDRLQFGSVTICKSKSQGDNKDGTFSNKEVCQNSCRVYGECKITQPALNAQTFFTFFDGCLTNNQNGSCSDQKCENARQSGQPILNEKVFDADGNVTETIINGVPVPGTVRPRIIAESYSDYNQTLQQETKALAFANMINAQSYNKSIQLNKTRQTSYAYRDEGYLTNGTQTKRLFVRIKPSNTLYDKTAYLYIILKVQSNSQDYLPQKCTQEKDPKNPSGVKTVCTPVDFYSKYYYLLDTNGVAKGFYKHQGYNITNYQSDGKYSSFNGREWVEGGASSEAKYFKTYTNILSAVEKNKYFIEEKVIENLSQAMSKDIEGLPKARAYWSVTTDPTIQFDPRTALIGEIYETLNPNLSNIPAYILAANQGRTPFIKGREAPVSLSMFVLISDKKLTNTEIGEKFITHEEENKKIHGVYNSLGLDTSFMKPKLDGDGTMGREIVDIYLVGTDKKLSAYANIETRGSSSTTADASSDVGKEGYLFYWFDDVGADPEKSSITHLAPNNQEIREVIKNMPANLTNYEIFKNKNFSTQASKTLKFGYGTGEFDQNSDCKWFSDGSKSFKLCLPWWRVEREYDAQESKAIASSEYKNFISSMQLPATGKQVSVCTKVDPLSNTIFNNTFCAKKVGDTCLDSFGNPIQPGSQILTCTSYYNRLAGEDCYDNPYQKKCFYDNCPTKVKQNCTLTNTIGFNDLKTLVKVDATQATGGRGDTQLKDTRIEVKTYGYKCPATMNVEINQVCSEEQTVMMYPAKCSASNRGATAGNISSSATNNISSSSQNNTTQHGGLFQGNNTSQATDNATIDELLTNKSNLIYCDTNKPIMTNGVLSGFTGVCPGTSEQVTCGFAPMKTETKVCVQPIIKKGTEVQRSTVIEERACSDHFVNIAAGEADIYKNDPKCFRANTAADSRNGTIMISAASDIAVKGLSITKNNQTKEESVFCTYNGTIGKLKGNCSQNTGSMLMRFTTTLQDSKDILFAELISGTENGNDLSGWQNDTPPRPAEPQPPIKFGSGFFANLIYQKQLNQYYRDLDNWKRWYQDNLNIGGFKPNYTYGTGNGFGGIGDEVPSVVINNANTYKSSALSLSSGMSTLNLFPVFERINLRFRWRYCTAPNVKVPSLDDLFKYHFAPQRGFFESSNGVFGPILNALTITATFPYSPELIGKLAKGFATDMPLFHFHTHWKIVPLIVGFSGCHGTWHGQEGHWRESNHNMFKVFSNSDVGLSIVFPTPSNYEIHFFNRDNNLLYTHTIKKGEMDQAIPGSAKPIYFAEKAKFYENGAETKIPLRNCADDEFSPAGGGTLYGSHSVTGAACDVAQPINFITENSIYSVTIVDLDTKIATTKKLTYPLPFLNNVYYSYAQKVESRRYTCCQDFAN